MTLVAGTDRSVRDPLSLVIALRPTLRFHERCSDGRPWYLIEDAARQRFFRVGADEFRFIALLDGRRTLADALARMAAEDQDRAFTETEALGICRWLASSQLLADYESGSPGGDGNSPRVPGKGSWRYVSPLVMRVPLFDAAPWLQRLFPLLGWCFTLPALAAWCGLVAWAGYLALVHADDLAGSSRVLLNGQSWWWLSIAWLGLKAVHELGHGLASIRFGCPVGKFGVMFILLFPAPYIDLSSTWALRSRGRRVAVCLAGMYLEVAIAALALVIGSLSSDPSTRYLAYAVAILGSINTIAVNANPLMRFDGYYVLSDLLDIQNLAGAGQSALHSYLAALLGATAAPDRLSITKKRLAAAYAIAAGCWRLVLYFGLFVAADAYFGLVGRAVALALVLAWIVPGAIKAFAGLRRAIHLGQRVSRPRLVVVTLSGLALSGALLLFLLGRGMISVEGTVEYAPLTIVRAESPGFVRRVCVQPGERVSAGQELVVLENRDLQLAQAELEARLNQSLVRCRLHRLQNELAKEEAERARHASLLAKQQELGSQIARLVVRAPCSGRVMGRSLSSIEGTYLATGDEIVSIGSDEAKEILLAVPQTQAEDCTAWIGHEVEVVSNGGSVAASGRPASLDPTASRTPPHRVLRARFGGPLPERIVMQEGEQASELLNAVFRARVALSPAESKIVRAGQLATVRIPASQSRLERAAEAARTLIDASRWPAGVE